jgi:holo-[acyl-carrier protein] synthase
MGVGLDLLEIERMERALARRPGLAERLFTRAEREYAAARARPAQHLAARFCAKEAVAKALGVEHWNPLDVEVVPGATGPTVRLSGALADLGADVQISLTHSRGIAGAVAVAS